MECGHHSVDVLFSDILSYRYLPDWLKLLVNYFNPLYVYIKQFRCIAHQGVMPDLTTIGLGFLYAFFFFWTGSAVFQEESGQVHSVYLGGVAVG